jgi:glycine betaine catabolism B
MWSKILDSIDNFLNTITMYRLVVYILISFLIIAVILADLKFLPFSPIRLLISITLILIISKFSNDYFAKIFHASTNIESVYITAFILALIISPPQSVSDLGIIFWAPLLATTSKYILAIGNKHLFNPVAIAVVLTSIGINVGASWWIGNAYMAFPVVIGSFLIIRKIRHQEMINSFLFTVIFLTIGLSIINGNNLGTTLTNLFLHSPLIFFAGIMLTEPLTSPSTKNLQFLFGILIGFLFVPQIHIGNYYFSPEEALLIGNIFSYFVSPKYKLILTLKRKIQIAADTFDFIFSPSTKIFFQAGQYMEWTYTHPISDNRGTRRYFTLASSPTETDIRISIKFPPHLSSFKKSLQLSASPTLIASQLSGDFTLPQDPKDKLVFIAGGIGVTPYRSMIKYLIDTNQKRDIILLYSSKNAAGIVYRDIFDHARSQFGLKIIYHLTESSGHFNQKNLPQLIPDYQQRKFYISGPHNLVSTTEKLLISLGINKSKIKTDFFPGFV